MQTAGKTGSPGILQDRFRPGRAFMAGFAGSAAALRPRALSARGMARPRAFDPNFSPLLIALAVFFADALTPVGLSLGTLYVFVVIYALWRRQRAVTIATGVACSAMMLIAIPLSPPGGDPQFAFAEWFISILTIWLIIPIGLRLQGSERKQVGAERNQKLRASEQDHRVRNSLAEALALINRVSRKTSDPAVVVDRLRTRIGGMLDVHSVLSTERYSPIALSEMVRMLVPDDARKQVQFDGPRVMIPARYAESVGLMLHELLSNSLRHGALSADGGVVRMQWQEAAPDSRTGTRLSMTWQESGGPAVPAEASPGLGSALIEGIVRHELGGTAELSYAPEGCSHRFELEFPVEAEVRTESRA